MQVKLNTPQDTDRLYHALCNAIAVSRGNTLETMPIEHIDHACSIAHSAKKQATDKWWTSHVKNLGL